MTPGCQLIGQCVARGDSAGLRAGVPLFAPAPFAANSPGVILSRANLSPHCSTLSDLSKAAQ